MLSIFAIFAWNLNILPQKYNLGHIKPDIIINIFCEVMEYPCASFYTILSSHVNTTNIFQFLTIFE